MTRSIITRTQKPHETFFLDTHTIECPLISLDLSPGRLQLTRRLHRPCKTGIEPSRFAVSSGIVCQPSLFPPIGIHDVDFKVSIPIGVERDLFALR